MRWNQTGSMEKAEVILSSNAPADGKAALFEAKYSKRPERMQEDCAAAVQQIDERMYASDLEDRCDEVFCYGISFYKKRWVIKKKE